MGLSLPQRMKSVARGLLAATLLMFVLIYMLVPAVASGDVSGTSTTSSTGSTGPSGPSGASGATGAPSPSPTPDPSPSTPVGTTGGTGALSPSPSPNPSRSPTPVGPTTSIIVQARAGLSQTEQADIIARNGGVETSSILVLRLHVVEVPADRVGQYLNAYQGDPDVESADKDRVREAEGAPNDSAYGQQWALPQIGWDQVYGSVRPSGSATIAVLDTGVQTGDVSLTGGFSAFGDDPRVDPNGHGTWLASIAAARTNDGSGIAGVAYDGVNVMPVQVLDANGLGQDSDIIAGVVYAADHGADVILMGFSNPGFSSALQDAIDYAWSKGAVLVAATGNDGSSAPNYPAGSAKVVGVSATDESDAL